LQTSALADLGVAVGGGTIGSTKSSAQRVRHYEIVGLCLKERVEERLKRFKEVMAVREEVIKDLTRRRKELLEDDITTNAIPSNHGGTATARAAARNGGVVATAPMPLVPRNALSTTTKMTKPKKMNSQLQSPLFTANTSRVQHKIRNNGATNSTRSSSGRMTTNGGATRFGGYGGIPPSAGYGGGYNSQAIGGGGGGLRQRPTGSSGYSSSTSTKSYYQNNNTTNTDAGTNSNNNNNNTNIHADQQSLLQIEERRTKRRTKHRLQSARQAETMLADLTSMFGKMSELIHSQGDTISKIEDDVEAGVDNVNAGVDEIMKLNEITKGNRSLIIKVFAILIFFIIAMRWF